MTLRLLNIILSVGALIFQAILFFPWTFAIIKFDGGVEGGGYLFLPLTLSLHFLLFSSLTVFLTFRNETLARRAFGIMTFIAAIATMLAFGYEGIMMTLLSVTLLLLAVLTWTRKIRLDVATLILNLILWASMIFWATQFQLDIGANSVHGRQVDLPGATVLK